MSTFRRAFGKVNEIFPLAIWFSICMQMFMVIIDFECRQISGDPDLEFGAWRLI
jgi:hypothetical protein